ncbi:cilia- and flagella-associated protein 91 [Chanos chanos]|uniref:Cilia- and flagella-associated protein 91 n=1 Tax=Chanos chanos TaxID=29144 RepID=A0A6J2WGK7_CHACN|nr:cilia- and flagella-associated protein 91 [Chanos chanos]
MSVSKTVTFPRNNDFRRGFSEQRAYDHLYDPVYTVSSEVDNARQSFRANASLDRVRKVPEFKNMFSNLPHHPSYTMRLDPLHASTDQHWRGQARENSTQLTGIAPHYRSQETKNKECIVTGADGWKYFKRPVSMFEQIPPYVVTALHNRHPYPDTAGGQERTPTPFERTVGVQTMYRESEAQTDPYSPLYTLRSGAELPELLTMPKLTWGSGLPAGLTEVEWIERSRQVEKLPTLNDPSQLGKVKRTLKKMEREKWAIREKEIEKLQEDRLALSMQNLLQRLAQRRAVRAECLSKYASQQQQEKEERMKKNQREYERTLRRLLAKRNLGGRSLRRDIIKEYSDYGSQVYAPLTRNGVFLDQNAQRYVVDTNVLDHYEALLKFEGDLPASEVVPLIKAPKLKRPTCRELKNMKDQEALKKEVLRMEEEKKNPLRLLKRIEKPVPLPPAPKVEAPPEGYEEKELAVIFLQKLLRGRAVQKQMFEGLEKHRNLIQELRTTHALQREGQELQESEKAVTLSLQKEAERHAVKVSVRDSRVAALSGAMVVDKLDALSLVLVRLQDEEQARVFMAKANRVRHLRVAEESKRRQEEEKKRAEVDEIYRQVVKVHQDTADQYLKEVIEDTVAQTADTQAREEIPRLAEKINDDAYAAEKTRNSQQSEEIVEQLVTSILIPGVQIISAHNKVREEQQKQLQASRAVITESIETSVVPSAECQGSLGPYVAQTLPPPSTRQPVSDVTDHVREGFSTAPDATACSPATSDSHPGATTAVEHKAAEVRETDKDQAKESESS